MLAGDRMGLRFVAADSASEEGQTGIGENRMAAERRQMIEQMRSGGEMVLVTLVRTDGSSYRRPGARLLLGSGTTSTGPTITGSISGGCLEGDLVRRAVWLTRSGAVMQHYSTAFDDTAEVPYGLGCGGELDVLLERSDTAEFLALRDALEASQGGAMRRVFSWLPAPHDPRLRRAVLAEDGAVLFASNSLSAAEILRASQTGDVSDAEAIFGEDLSAPQRLVLCGAGDDARPMTVMGRLLGWTVVVADGRRSLARAERFPEADEVLLLERPEDLLVRREDAVVVMTHSYEQDRALLRAVLPARPSYLGLLGARHRSSLLISEVAMELGWSIEESCAGLHTPVGLDLGGDGPEAIALAVVAEIQACVQSRTGHFRQLSAADVLEWVARGGSTGSSAYLSAPCAMGER